MLASINGSARRKCHYVIRHTLTLVSSRPDGVRFTAAAGTSEFVKKWTPKIGDIVSFKHRGFLLGTKRPKLPSLHRLRPDLTWEDVVENWSDKKTAAAPTEGKLFPCPMIS